MTNSLTTILILIVGLSLVLSIILNRLILRIGSVLLKKSLSVQFPLSKTIDLETQEQCKPKRVIFTFNKSTGFYSGKIAIKNGSFEVGSCELPVRSEYTAKSLGFYNEDISRQSNVIIIRIRNYKADCPLTLDLHLCQNIHDPVLRNKLELSNEDQIELEVRGGRA